MKTGEIGLVQLACLVLAAFGACRGAEPSDEGSSSLRVATFNVHYLSTRREILPWDGRREAVASAIAETDADIIAFQEMETFGGSSSFETNIQLEFVLERFPQYRPAAVADPRVYPSTQPILYRSDLLEPIDQGFFFYSSEPDTIYSRPWHGRFPAFTSWVRFRDRRTELVFVVYNNHFDASNAQNRLRSAQLLVKRIAGRPEPNEPIIVLGDFNAPWFFPSMSILRRSGLNRARVTGSTFHLNRGINLIPAIDHILTGDGARAVDARVIRSRFGGAWPSDHYPVVAQIELP